MRCQDVLYSIQGIESLYQQQLPIFLTNRMSRRNEELLFPKDFKDFLSNVSQESQNPSPIFD